MTRLQSLIAGSWADGAGPPIACEDPATGAVVAEFRAARADEVDAAVAAAAAAQRRCWGPAPARERRDWLGAIADAIEDNAERLAEAEAGDTGLPIAFTEGGHIPRAIECFRHFGELASQAPGEWFALDGAYATLVDRRPLGVVAVLAPWNAPLAVAAMNVAAALAAGNAVILKPSERTPVSSTLLARLIDGLGLPAGVFGLVHGGAAVGAQLAGHAGIDGVCFVGGLDNGRRVLAAAAPSLKRVLLELGGASPTIVFADALFEAALDGAILSAFSGNGEVCTAGARILVERSLHARFAAAFAARAEAIRIGPPLDRATELGPLIDRRHHDHVTGLVADALRRGARLLAGGGRPAALPRGHYHAPTVLDAVPAEAELRRREVFGPVAMLLPFDGEDAAVAAAAEGVAGLAATIWTADLARGARIARRLGCGGAAVNAPFVRDVRAPFGGIGTSGLGRVGGRWSLDAYSEPTTLCLPVAPFALPRLGAAGRGERQ